MAQGVGNRSQLGSWDLKILLYNQALLFPTLISPNIVWLVGNHQGQLKSRLACRKSDFFLPAASVSAATTRAPSAGLMAELQALVTAARAASTDSLPSHILPGTCACYRADLAANAPLKHWGPGLEAGGVEGVQARNRGLSNSSFAFDDSPRLCASTMASANGSTMASANGGISAFCNSCLVQQRTAGGMACLPYAWAASTLRTSSTR